MNWLYATIQDTPELLEANETVEIYRIIQRKFLQDVQPAFKKIAKEALLIYEMINAITL